MAHEELKDKIAELEAQLKTTKVNKKTEMAVGQMKGKIAKLKEELEVKLSKGSSKGDGFAVKKEGDATVGLLGKPSVGKSTLLGKITNKESKIGAYEFTTLDCIPGLLHFKHTNLQILDLPGIIDKASDNRGFGKKVLSVVRACDLVLLVIDARFPLEEMEMLLRETHNAKIRFNQLRPNIDIRRTSNGGVQVPLNNSSQTIKYELVESVMHDMKHTNAEIIIHERNVSVDDFIDSCYGNLVYQRAMICLNKIDLFTPEEMKEKIALLSEKYPEYPLFGVSAETGINLEKLNNFIWEKLGFAWVYLKEARNEPDMTKPLVIKQGESIYRICERIHKDMLIKFKYAKVKGPSAKFDWQRVGLDHIVQDTDIIEIYAR